MWSIFSRNALSSLPYEILEQVSSDDNQTWKLHRGKRKQSGEEVSIFVCDSSMPQLLELAKGAVKRLKMLRHPCVLTYLDSLESEKSVYLVTEAVTPLLKWFSDLSVTTAVRSNIAAWGLLQVTKGLSFLNNGGNLAHNNICEGSIFVTHGGEWKISGFEYASADPNKVPFKASSDLNVYQPPEHQKSSRSPNLWAADMWGFGCLMWEVFNHKVTHSQCLEDTSSIPQQLLATYRELTSTQPARRPNPSVILERLQQPNKFFHNDLIEVLSVLDEIALKDEAAKQKFFSTLVDKLDNIPAFIAKNKILPALLSAHEFSNVGSVILTPLFKIGQMLEPKEYQNQIVPCVVKLFASNDRATRLKLLQQIESLSEHLDSKTINEQIFQPLASGLRDSNPTIREHSIKAILHLAPKLNYENLNTDVMKHFAALQGTDSQGGIRTNTTVCLGKIACYLHADTRKKCLVSAFTRAMKDKFPPARIAGVTAIAATQQYYPLSDVARRIIPTLSLLTLDPEKSVRDTVFRVLKGFVGKLEKVSEDPSLQEVMEKEVASSSTPSSNASAWAGWAVGALTSKFYKVSTVQKPPVESSNTSTPSTGTSSVTSLSPIASGHNSPQKILQPEKISNKRETSISSQPNDNLIDFDQAGDGWDDDEEWGSLETAPMEPIEPEANSKSSSSYAWNEPSNSDFFSSFESKPSNKSVTPQVPVKVEDSWEDWESTNLIDTGMSKNEEMKKQREAKRLQRQKEIESKRASRTGPMKLGARKIP